MCTDTLRRPLVKVNEQVIAWIQAALTPELVFRVVADLRAQHRQETGEGEKQIAALERDAIKIRREIDRLVGALAVTDDKPDAIVNGIADRQARLRDLDAKISAARPPLRRSRIRSRGSSTRRWTPSGGSTRP